MRLQKTWVVALLAIFCCLLWGSAFPCIKIGYEWCSVEGPGSQILFAGWRFFLAGLMTLAIFAVIDKKIVVPKKEMIIPIIGQGFLQTTVQYFFFYLGLAETTGSRGSIFVATNAFFSILIAHFVIKGERMTRRKILGCIIGFAGVLVINMHPGEFGTGFSMTGDSFILLSAAAYGTSSVTTKMLSGKEKPETITAWQLMTGGLILIVTGYLLDGSITISDVPSKILFIYLSLLSAVSFTIWAFLLKYNPVGKVAPYGFTNPIFGTALSGILLHEDILKPENLVALILVCIGVIYVNTDDSGRKRAKCHIS